MGSSLDNGLTKIDVVEHGRTKTSWPFVEFMDGLIPRELMTDPERTRRARLITRFGILGSSFGSVYALFYLMIGHIWGAGIVIVCSAGVLMTPLFMRWKKSTEPAGNLFSLTLTVGFFALALVEGGVHGHAISWLVSVPLCALLLIGRRSACWWAVFAFSAAGIIIGIDLAGHRLPLTYDSKWEPLVSAIGYLGLIVFLFLLGMIFEFGRAQASKRMEEALSKLAASNERLSHLNNEKTEFLGIAAHDLKNPLTVILGSAELIRSADNHQLVAKCSQSITMAATRMRDLITTLLDANAIEQGKYISKIEPSNINDILMECIESHRTRAERKTIGLRIGTSDALWAMVDRAATMQIFDNLISNALKFSPPQTTLSVHTLPEKDFVLIKIHDEGPGISAEDQTKLFQKFSRLTARPTAGESSNGLGLSIVKRLVEVMGGRIECQSTVGVGTTFMVRLPACAAQTKPQHTPGILFLDQVKTERNIELQTETKRSLPGIKNG